MESRHNPQFRPVRRTKIFSFGEQEASDGLILTPLGMTPRARGAAVRLLVFGCAVPCPRIRLRDRHSHSFSLKRKECECLLSSLKIISFDFIPCVKKRKSFFHSFLKRATMQATQLSFKWTNCKLLKLSRQQ